MGRSKAPFKGEGIAAMLLKLRVSKMRHDSTAARFSDVSLNAIDADGSGDSRVRTKKSDKL